MSLLDLTATGIIRALSAIDDAVRNKAEVLAAQLSRRGIEVRVDGGGNAEYAVVASGEDLFAREFGGLNRQADKPIEAAIESLKARVSE